MNKPVVLISGATGTTGSTAARAFAQHGASLALIGNHQAKLDQLSLELNLPPGRVLTCAADLRKAEEVRAAAALIHTKYGHVDIMLHLVGGWTGGKSLVETPAEDLETMINQHVWTTFHLIQAVTPGMVQNRWGRVIVVSSPLATNPAAKMGAYAIGKAAEEVLLLTQAKELEESGVTTNVIQVLSIGCGEKATSPEDIIAAMMYLCSDEAAKINGTRIPLY